MFPVFCRITASSSKIYSDVIASTIKAFGSMIELLYIARLAAAGSKKDRTCAARAKPPSPGL